VEQYVTERRTPQKPVTYCCILAARFGSPDGLLPEEIGRGLRRRGRRRRGQPRRPSRLAGGYHAGSSRKLVGRASPSCPRRSWKRYGEKCVVEDPIIQHMASTKLTQMLRKQPRARSSRLSPRPALAASEVRALCVTL
jgi:hypothetical protein